MKKEEESNESSKNEEWNEEGVCEVMKVWRIMK